MTRDVDVLTAWLLIVVVIAAISATAVPVLYSRSNWRSRPLGKRFMAQAISFAAALDTTVLFQFWHPDILVMFWMETAIFTVIALSTFGMALKVWKLRNPGEVKIKMLFSNKVYERLKFVVQILLPALSGAYFALGQIWHFPDVEEIVGSIAVITTFLGALLRVSSNTYNNSDAKYDGSFHIEETEDGSQLRLHNVDLKALDTKNELTFKVNR